MSEEPKKAKKRQWNDRLPGIPGRPWLEPGLKKSKESSAPTQASSQASSQNMTKNPGQLIEKQNSPEQQEAVARKSVSSQQASQADSQQSVAIPEPENDTTNPSEFAALAQDSLKSPAVSEQEAQLPFQDALTLSCPDGSSIHLKVESSQARSSISVKSQDLNIEIASPAPRCRLL